MEGLSELKWEYLFELSVFSSLYTARECMIQVHEKIVVIRVILHEMLLFVVGINLMFVFERLTIFIIFDLTWL